MSQTFSKHNKKQKEMLKNTKWTIQNAGVLMIIMNRHKNENFRYRKFLK